MLAAFFAPVPDLLIVFCAHGRAAAVRSDRPLAGQKPVQEAPQGCMRLIALMG